MKSPILMLLFSFILSSCSVINGPNYDNRKKVQHLKLGMTKEEAISVMGKEYILESMSQEENGTLEIIKYYSELDVPYLLHFLNDRLILFNRYYPPHIPE